MKVNNTSACDAEGVSSHCVAPFTGMADPAGNTYNSAPQNISTVDVHELLYPSNTTRVFTHLMPWFCMDPIAGPGTGIGSACQKHLQVGYDSNNAAVVHAQMQDMQQRGFNGTVVDWYGSRFQPEFDAVAQKVRDDLSAQCTAAQECPFSFALTYDQGSFQWKACPQDGAGVDQTQCIVDAMALDFDYMNEQYFSSDAYTRVDKADMSIKADGKPIVLFYICESCFTNPAPNWGYIWAQLRQHVNTYGENTPTIYFLFRNAGAFTHVESDGAFAWPNWYGSNDAYGFQYLDHFYNTALGAISGNSRKITFGAAWKGFDASSAPWGNPRRIPQQCGNTWIQSFKEVTYKNAFGPDNQLPFLQVATWNDYEEGTEIESGIDNCLTVTPSLSASTLKWSATFSDASGTEATVHHYVVFESTEGVLTEIATVPVSQHSLNLSVLNLSQGEHTFFVQAVGQPSITNKISEPINFTALALSLTLSTDNVIEGQSAIATVRLSTAAPEGGMDIELSSSDPAASLPATINIPAGTTTADVPVKTYAVESITPAIISATNQGTTLTATLNVRPATIALGLDAASVTAGNASLGTVTLSSAAPDGGVTVTLTSSDASAQVPASVVIPAGETTQSFNIGTSAVADITTATISATRAASTQSATLTINPLVFTVSLAPAQLVGGASGSGTLKLSSPAPSAGLTFSLSSSDSSATVPTGVSIAAGGTQAVFTFTTRAVGVATTAVISASTSGVTKSATLNLLPLYVSSLVLSPTNVGGSIASKGTITLNTAAPAGGAIVQLSSTNAVAKVPVTVAVAAGAKTASFSVTTSAVTVKTTVTIAATLGSSKQSAALAIYVTPASLTLLPTSVKGGYTSKATITLTGPASSSGAVITLTSSSTAVATVPTSVTVPAGAKTATFTVTTKRVSVTSSVSITAKYMEVKKSGTLSITR